MKTVADTQARRCGKVHEGGSSDGGPVHEEHHANGINDERRQRQCLQHHLHSLTIERKRAANIPWLHIAPSVALFSDCRWSQLVNPVPVQADYPALIIVDERLLRCAHTKASRAGS